MKIRRPILVTLFVGLILVGSGVFSPQHSHGQQGIDQLQALFEEPGAEYRGKPFWSWNGKLEKDELIRQIHILKEMGFGGFFMHSRTGLATEYLGEEWFDLINICADEAQKLGMEAWLYDEDRWPSGSAGGKATENPAYRMQYLRIHFIPGDKFTWPEEAVAAFACDLDGLNYKNCVQLTVDSPQDAYQGKTVLLFTTELMASHPFYNGNAYLDTMNREATDYFIELTHERYKAKCGDRLGTSIKGIFTDEPHRGMVMCKNVSQGSITESENITPFTPALFAEFEKRFGYDLLPHLPELFLRPEGRQISKVKWQYMELLQQLFLENFAKPIHDWCQANNMMLTGHVLHEDSLGAQAVPNGSMMRFYEYMDYPGVDVLTEGNRNYWIVKQLASAARQLGKTWLMSELYGCTGWQMPFAAHKAVGDWQSLFGINLRCHHLSWYTMEGEAKRDYPASIAHQSTWYKEYDTVENYFSRLQAVMTQGKPVCDILVLNPIESTWAQIHAGWASWLSATTPSVVELDRKYMQLFHWLSGAQLDFDYGEEDFIRRMARVEITPDGPLLRVGQSAYKTVVVSGMETIRETTLAVLESFIQAGGMVIFAGEAPAYVDVEESPRAKALADRAVQVSFDRDSVIQACLQDSSRPVEVVDAKTGQPMTEIFCQVREEDGYRYILTLNTNRDKGYANTMVRVQGQGAVEEWDCLTGERWQVAAKKEGDFLVFHTDFPAAGEHLYVLAPSANPALASKPVYRLVSEMAFKGPFAYILDEPNLCVLDRADYKLNDQPWQGEKEILKVDQAIRRELGMDLRGGEMLQPWFTGLQEHPVKAELSLRFSFEIETMPSEITLLMERPELFAITVNDMPLDSGVVTGWMIDTCLKTLPIPTDGLKMGENIIELKVGFHHGINLEAIYLVGPFGVKVEDTRCSLTILPETLAIGDVTQQGLPFYSGRIHYKLPLPEFKKKEAALLLACPDFEGACVQIPQPDADPLMIAWPPYQANITRLAGQEVLDLVVVLTRRNTFGPLHQVPLNTGAYGPGNWITEGAGFTENYNLYPAGLLQAPRLQIVDVVN